MLHPNLTPYSKTPIGTVGYYLQKLNIFGAVQNLLTKILSNPFIYAYLHQSKSAC